MGKPMRGYWWYLILIIAIIFIVMSVMGLTAEEGPGSYLIQYIGGITAGVIYIILFFTMPPVISRHRAKKFASFMQNWKPSYPLDEPAVITVTRDEEGFGFKSASFIAINGRPAISLADGESGKILSSESHVKLVATAEGAPDGDYELDVLAGERIEIHIVGNEFKPDRTKRTGGRQPDGTPGFMPH